MISKDKKNKNKKIGKNVAVLVQQKKSKMNKMIVSVSSIKLHVLGEEMRQLLNVRHKKCMLVNFICSEVNLTSVPRHTWWIDFSATTHISVFMQDYLCYHKLSEGVRFIYVGDGKLVKVEVIDTFGLLLRTEYYLD